MGACLSGNHSSSSHHQQQSASSYNNHHHHHSSSSSTTWRNNSSSSTTNPKGEVAPPSYPPPPRGSGMRDGELSHHHHRLTSTPSSTQDNYASSSNPPSTVAQNKGDKKNFYSRIPPLGRVGSTTADKGERGGGGHNKANNPHYPIKDNNNAYSESRIGALFDTYKDPYEDAVGAEGIQRLCKDLDVRPEDFKMLLLAWKFGAEQMCRFSRQEFFQGMKELGTDTLPGIQARLPDLVAQVMSDSLKFKDLYRFSFKFGLDAELSQRILPLDMATSLWRLVFCLREPPILERWISFLESSSSGIRGIPKDTWDMFLVLVETVGPDLSNYDDTEAWPSLFDDFVEYENDALNQNTISKSSPQQKNQQHALIQRRLSPN